MFRFLGKAVVLTLFSILLGSSTRAEAAPAQGDYDGNGRSDLAVALVDRQARTTAWLVRLTDRSHSYFWTFNIPGDALVTGQFFKGNTNSYPGIVYVSDARVPLNWYVK